MYTYFVYVLLTWNLKKAILAYTNNILHYDLQLLFFTAYIKLDTNK